MQLSRVDLNLFTIFDAIYRDGGITPASKRLHLSQPAVSHALARLRELLDDPLFERRGHDMVPTPLARSIAANVASSLGGLEQLLQRTGRFDPGTLQNAQKIIFGVVIIVFLIKEPEGLVQLWRTARVRLVRSFANA